MAPKAGDAALPIKQITADAIGSNPSPTIMAAGIATAVPKPAIPSMKLPKHQPRINAATRLSLDTDASMFLITSIPPVRRLRLYTNMAPNIMIPIGQMAARAPSNAPVPTSTTDIPYTAIHSTAVMIRPMPQALKPDILNAVIEMISHAIGIIARITCNNITLSLSLV